MPALDEVPEIGPEWEQAWDGFQVLSRARGGNGFGPNPIAVSEVAAYAGLVGYWDPEELLRVVQEMDREYMEHWAKKHPK